MKLVELVWRTVMFVGGLDGAGMRGKIVFTKSLGLC